VKWTKEKQLLLRTVVILVVEKFCGFYVEEAKEEKLESKDRMAIVKCEI